MPITRWASVSVPLYPNPRRDYMKYTFKSEVAYEVQCQLTGILVQVITWPNIMWKYRVILHDTDAGEQLPAHKSFKSLDAAKAYADECVDYTVIEQASH